MSIATIEVDDRFCNVTDGKKVYLTAIIGERKGKIYANLYGTNEIKPIAFREREKIDPPKEVGEGSVIRKKKLEIVADIFIPGRIADDTLRPKEAIFSYTLIDEDGNSYTLIDEDGNELQEDKIIHEIKKGQIQVTFEIPITFI